MSDDGEEALRHLGFVKVVTYSKSEPQRTAAPSQALDVYVSPLRWIRLAQYCALSGDSADAVHARRRKRQWIDGKHCCVGPDGHLWVNPEEVNRWVEGA